MKKQNDIKEYENIQFASNCKQSCFCTNRNMGSEISQQKPILDLGP